MSLEAISSTGSPSACTASAITYAQSLKHFVAAGAQSDGDKCAVRPSDLQEWQLHFGAMFGAMRLGIFPQKRKALLQSGRQRGVDRHLAQRRFPRARLMMASGCPMPVWFGHIRMQRRGRSSRA